LLGEQAIRYRKRKLCRLAGGFGLAKNEAFSSRALARLPAAPW
jgi:hypothetical protein